MILLDYRDKRPIYEQVVEKLERLILGGALEPDSKMPSVRSMGVDLAVNPNTIQRAYNQLEQEGYLYTVSGRGSFVAPEKEWREGKKKKALKEWADMTERAKEAGLTQEALLEELDRIYGGSILSNGNGPHFPLGNGEKESADESVIMEGRLT